VLCSGCEQEQRQRGNTSWDSNCLGAGCHSAGLLCRSHLWCPFQSCCHHCFCFHQKVSLEAGEPNTQFFPLSLIIGSSWWENIGQTIVHLKLYSKRNLVNLYNISKER